MRFWREGYSANKFIAYGEEMYDDFSRQPGVPVNIACHGNSIVLTMSGVDIVYERLVMPCYGYTVVIQSSYLILSLKNIKEYHICPMLVQRHRRLCVTLSSHRTATCHSALSSVGERVCGGARRCLPS